MSELRNKSSFSLELIYKLVVGFLLAGFIWFATIPYRNHHGGPSLKSVCINSLRQIDGAKEQWALETHAKPGDIAPLTNVTSYIKGGFPKCPQGGSYTIGRVGENPKCSVPGHSL
ncbi:MAG TPA: hypothetical protein VIJ24_04405 [Verrucomicrobiae bacterium]|jgi:hypothetical protein